MGTAAICGTYQKCHAASIASRGRSPHLLGMHPERSLSPNDFYKQADPRFKTNSKNKSSIVWGDNRDVQFKTMNLTNYCPPSDVKLAPALHSLEGLSQDEIKAIYSKAAQRVGEEGVRAVERAMMSKLQQRTAGGQGGLRSAFKYFDRDASGTIDLDEFFKVLEFIGFTFTEDQVTALFGYYDQEYNGELDYYAFINRVLDGSGGNSSSLVPKQRRYGAGGPVAYKVGQNADKLIRWDVKRVFDKFDFDKSGAIETKELSLLLQALGFPTDPVSVRVILESMDRNNNKTVDFEEFYAWFTCEAAKANHKKDSSFGSRNNINMKDLKLAY